MRGFLIDTCAISEFVKASPNLGLVQWLARMDPTIIYMSAVTIGELRYGIALQSDERKREHLERWLQRDVLAAFKDRVLPLDTDVAARWGRLRAGARAAGRTIPVIDAMIAATAIHHNVMIVTRNEADFRAAGVDVVNPWT